MESKMNVDPIMMGTVAHLIEETAQKLGIPARIETPRRNEILWKGSCPVEAQYNGHDKIIPAQAADLEFWAFDHNSRVSIRGVAHQFHGSASQTRWFLGDYYEVEFLKVCFRAKDDLWITNPKLWIERMRAIVNVVPYVPSLNTDAAGFSRSTLSEGVKL